MFRCNSVTFVSILRTHRAILRYSAPTFGEFNNCLWVSTTLCSVLFRNLITYRILQLAGFVIIREKTARTYLYPYYYSTQFNTLSREGRQRTDSNVEVTFSMPICMGEQISFLNRFTYVIGPWFWTAFCIICMWWKLSHTCELQRTTRRLTAPLLQENPVCVLDTRVCVMFIFHIFACPES